jgi:hypothetical protein
MHIMEGFLPTTCLQTWFTVSIPVIMYGIDKMNRLVNEIFTITQISPIIKGAVSSLLFKNMIEIKKDTLVEMRILEDTAVRKLRGFPV